MWKQETQLEFNKLIMFEQDQSVQLLSHVRLFATPKTAVCQASLSISSSQSCSNHLHRVHDETLLCWVGDVIQPFFSSVIPFSFCLQSFLASGSFLMSKFFTSGGKSFGASPPASLFPMNIQNFQNWFPLGLTGFTPCSPRDLQESSPTPQFKNINSLALSFLYGSTRISIHDYWKNHSFD